GVGESDLATPGVEIGILGSHGGTGSRVISGALQLLLGAPVGEWTGLAEEVALGRGHAQRGQLLNLLLALDPLADDERAGSDGEGHDRLDHRAGGGAVRAALDQAKVDLDHVEMEVAEQLEAGVAGAEVIGG